MTGDSTEAVPLTAATLRGMDERHSPTDDYRGDRPHRANHKTGSIPFCRTCRTAWPCDARRLLDAARTADPGGLRDIIRDAARRAGYQKAGEAIIAALTPSPTAPERDLV